MSEDNKVYTMAELAAHGDETAALKFLHDLLRVQRVFGAESVQCGEVLGNAKDHTADHKADIIAEALVLMHGLKVLRKRAQAAGLTQFVRLFEGRSENEAKSLAASIKNFVGPVVGHGEVFAKVEASSVELVPGGRP